jgi:hypothetical protein
LLAAIVIRAALSILKVWEIYIESREPNQAEKQPTNATGVPARFWKEYGLAFIGIGSKKDYLQPFILGFLELSVFPVLMATGHWNFVGAWVGFKAIAQATLWKEKREVFGRFLIGTALCLIVSYFLATAITLPKCI